MKINQLTIDIVIYLPVYSQFNQKILVPFLSSSFPSLSKLPPTDEAKVLSINLCMLNMLTRPFFLG